MDEGIVKMNCRALCAEKSDDELLSSGYVQTEDAILSASAGRYASINQQIGKILSFLHGQETIECQDSLFCS